MGFGALRSVIRPVSRILLTTRSNSVFAPLRFPTATSPSPTPTPANDFHGHHHIGSFHRIIPFIPSSSAFHSLTDTRFPKRRPCYNPGRKRASMKPPGPYAWVKCKPGEPIVPKQPNEGSVKRRNEKKRIKLHRAFILAEKKKRTALIQEAKRKKIIKRVERKMAAVARERAWAQRLIELQQIEEEKKTAMT